MATPSSADPNGYGTCVGYFSMNSAMSLLTGVDCVVDDVLVRLSTASLWYSPGFGYDVQSLVNSSVDPVAAVSNIEKQVLQDDRVQSAVATYSFVGDALQVYVAVTLTGGEQFQLVGAPTTAGSFVFSVSSLN